MTRPEDVLEFWLDTCGPDEWYAQDAKLDADIRDRFSEAWEGACQGRHSLWLTFPSGALAYIILTDQFSRNMFRGDGKSYSSDRIARTAAKLAIEKRWDMKIDVPARQFFYLPLMHSENLVDQDRSVRLIFDRMGAGNPNLLHARAHREVIRKFGRFPHRNADLGRATTQAEQAYIDAGGYGQIVRDLEHEAAA